MVGHERHVETERSEITLVKIFVAVIISALTPALERQYPMQFVREQVAIIVELAVSCETLIV